MASKQTDPVLEAVAAFALFGLVVALVAIVSPIFLGGAAVIIGYKVVRSYQNSPNVLARKARQQSLALFARAQTIANQNSFPDADDFADQVIGEFMTRCEQAPPTYGIVSRCRSIAELLYEVERLTSDAVPAPPPIPDTFQDARYQDKLCGQITKTNNPAAAEIARDALVEAFVRFTNGLPPIALQTADGADPDRPAQFTIPLIEAASNIGRIVEELILSFFSGRAHELGLFADLRRQLEYNHYSISGVPIGEVNSPKLIMPSEHAGTPEEIVSGYLCHTPLERLFAAELPFNIAPSSRLEHWHLVAGSGHGKTQTLQHIIMGDLQAEDPPALIIVDSQGDMLRKLQKLAVFENSDRLVVIDPEDDCAPALNMFDMSRNRMRGYSRAVREQVEAGIIELFNYVFAALASELTAKQGTAFAYITRLMLAIPGATIHTFRELMESADRSTFAAYIEGLDATSRAFFENQFFNRTAFGETRQQIARRLYTVLQVPAFERMFASPVNKLDMFAAMQSRKVVLVNTSKALLKTDASALFGRYMIALTLNAAFERVAIPESLRRPAYLIVDEAAEYFDETLERLLAQARKFKLGVLFAHQHMDQLTPALRSAVAANTSIKMAGGVSDHDARALAADMRTSPAFISAVRKRTKSTEFACQVRNFTEGAVRISVPFGTMENAPKMSRGAFQEMLRRNRNRFAVEAEPNEEPAVTLNRPDLPWKLEPATHKPKRHDPDDVDIRPTET